VAVTDFGSARGEMLEQHRPSHSRSLLGAAPRAGCYHTLPANDGRWPASTSAVARLGMPQPLARKKLRIRPSGPEHPVRRPCPPLHRAIAPPAAVAEQRKSV